MTLRKKQGDKRLPRELQVCLVVDFIDTGQPGTYEGPSPPRMGCGYSKKHSAEKLLTGEHCKNFSKSKKTLETTGFSRLQRELQIHPGLPDVKSHEDAKHQTFSLITLSGSCGKGA